MSLRWVFVHDLDGTHREEYFFSTDPMLTPRQIIGLFTARWSVEVTFQEAKEHLGLARTRNWSPRSVLWLVPCLLGLFTLVSLIFARQVKHRKLPLRRTDWYAKRDATFADALATVRRLLWWTTVLKHPLQQAGIPKLPLPIRSLLLEQLSYAA